MVLSSYLFCFFAVGALAAAVVMAEIVFGLSYLFCFSAAMALAAAAAPAKQNNFTLSA